MNEFEFLKVIAMFIFGTFIGSFLNVVIYRMPRDLSIIYPPSTCPVCKNQIKWYDNIPIVSYLILKGRCRFCNTKISLRYPMVEFITGIMAVFTYLKFDFSVFFIFNFYFVASMIALSFIDLDFKIIPDEINFSGLFMGLVYATYKAYTAYDVYPVFQSLIGALTGAGFLYALALFYLKVRKIEGLGMGDVKLLAFVGSYLGWFGSLFTIFFGSLLALIGTIFFMKGSKESSLSKLEIPFGPFLAIASIVYLFFGDWIYSFYFGG